MKAYELFNDDEWDGEPMKPTPKKDSRRTKDRQANWEPPGKEYGQKPKMVKITLADGKERQIQHMTQTTFYPDGTPTLR